MTIRGIFKLLRAIGEECSSMVALENMGTGVDTGRKLFGKSTGVLEPAWNDSQFGANPNPATRPISLRMHYRWLATNPLRP